MTAQTKGTSGVPSSSGVSGPPHGANDTREAGERQAQLLESLAARLADAAQFMRSGERGVLVAHQRVGEITQELLAKARSPPEVIMGWFQNMAVVSAVHLFQDWKVFDMLPPDEPMTYAELASRVDAQESLVIRIAWMLTSTDVLKQIGLDRITHTPISLMLREGEAMGSMFKVMFTNVGETAAILPSYFAKYGRKEPDQLNHIPTSFLAGQPELPYFDLLHQDKERMRNFMRAMAISYRRVPTVGMYDLGWLVKMAADDAAAPTTGDDGAPRPLWVDIGGGNGHTLQLFRRAYPGLPADRCVIQDLPEVAEEAARSNREALLASDPGVKEGAELLRGTRWIGFDFHREAPVPGAAAYYMRHILHDYPDEVVADILRRIASVMAPDSRVLIADQVMANPPPSPHAAFKDFVMMPVGGKERTVENLGRVVAAAGLRIAGVFKDANTPNAVIECLKADV